jgi:hypothetical protein
MTASWSTRHADRDRTELRRYTGLCFQTRSCLTQSATTALKAIAT